MPRERLSMRNVREILRLKFEQGLSHRAIARSCQIGLGTVNEYISRANASDIGWPLPADVSNETLEAQLFPRPSCPTSPGRPLPDWSAVALELRRKGVTLFLLWEEYHRQHPDGYGYSRYCDLYRQACQISDPRMRQVHKAGEKLFVDYAGQTLPVVDRSTGEVRQAQIFVATLGASNLTYVEATWTQGQSDWIGSHVRAFEFIGGCPQIVVPDNLKSAVLTACRYEPGLNPSYQEMAAHYGVTIIPTRVRKPRDKAKVENHVLITERRILAPLRDRTFISLSECNEAIADLLADLNERPFQKMLGSRRALFEEVDLPTLRPLPVQRYEYAQWNKARVSIDYHVSVEGSYYSVPYTLLKKEVDARLSDKIVEIFHKGQRVASHRRSYRQGTYSTDPGHMPKAHKDWADWTPERLVRWAKQTGPETQRAIESILERRVHPQQGFRSCMGVLRLSKEYGPQRLEAACGRALGIGSPTYKSVHSILKAGLDRIPLDKPEPMPKPQLHANVRGAAYYQTAFQMQDNER